MSVKSSDTNLPFHFHDSSLINLQLATDVLCFGLSSLYTYWAERRGEVGVRAYLSSCHCFVLLPAEGGGVLLGSAPGNSGGRLHY